MAKMCGKIPKEVEKYLVAIKEDEDRELASADELENFLRGHPRIHSVDPRGTLFKEMNRYTPGGQHKGDGFIAVDTFYKRKKEQPYYGLLRFLNLNKWGDYTGKIQERHFDPSIHFIDQDIYRPSDSYKFESMEFSRLERIILFRDNQGNKFYEKRWKKASEEALYYIETPNHFKVGKSKNPRSRIKSVDNEYGVIDFVVFPANENVTENSIIKNFSKHQYPSLESEERFKKNGKTRSFMKAKNDAIMQVVSSFDNSEVNLIKNYGLNENTKKFFKKN